MNGVYVHHSWIPHVKNMGVPTGGPFEPVEEASQARVSPKENNKEIISWEIMCFVPMIVIFLTEALFTHMSYARIFLDVSLAGFIMIGFAAFMTWLKGEGSLDDGDKVGVMVMAIVATLLPYSSVQSWITVLASLFAAFVARWIYRCVYLKLKKD